jgi:hypothetical protein
MQTNQEIVKSAAKRMCTLLASKGIDVKQTQMLDALAEGFGLDNWRTLKAVIDQPRAPQRKSKPLGTPQSWDVEALYRDNNQQYGQDFMGRTPLEAAYACMMDRLTDFALKVDVLNVYNQDRENCLSPSFIGEIELESNRAVLETLLTNAKKLSNEKWSPDQQLALKWLAAVLDYYPQDNFRELTDYESAEAASFDAGDTITETSTLTPEAALRLLVDTVEVAYGGVVKLEEANEALSKQLYQVLAMCDYFGNVLNDDDVGGLAFFDVTA